LKFQGLKNNSAIGSPSGNTYSYVLGLRGWTDNSGGMAHEFAFNDTGIYRRIALSTASWDDWNILIDSKNWGSYIGVDSNNRVKYATDASRADTLDGLHAAAFALTGHTHSEYALASHTHSYAALSHTHGNITSDGKIGSTANLVVITDANKLITTAAKVPIGNLPTGTSSS